MKELSSNSNQIKSNQIKSNQIKSNQIKSNQSIQFVANTMHVRICLFVLLFVFVFVHSGLVSPKRKKKLKNVPEFVG